MKRHFHRIIAVTLSLSMVTLSPGLPCYGALGDLLRPGSREIDAAGRGMRPRFVQLSGDFSLNQLPHLGASAAAINPDISTAFALSAPDAIGFPDLTKRIKAIAELRLFTPGVMAGSVSASLPPDGPSNGFARFMETLRSGMERFNRAANNGMRRGAMAKIFGESKTTGMEIADISGEDTAALVTAPNVSGPENGTRLRQFRGMTAEHSDFIPNELPHAPRSSVREGIRGALFQAVPFGSTVVSSYASAHNQWVWVRGLLRMVAETGVDIKKKLAVASGLALATAVLSPLTVYFYSRITTHISGLSQALPHAGSAWYKAVFNDVVLRDFAISALAMVGVYSVMGICRFLFIKTTHDIGNQVMHVLFQKMARHAIALPMQWHRAHPPGDLLAVSDGALDRLQSIFTNAIIKPVNNGVLSLVALGGMLMLCGWHMVLILLPFFILPAIPSIVYQRLINKAFSKLYCEGKPSLMRTFSAILGNVKHIKAARMEEHAMQSIDDASRQAHLAMGGTVVKALAPFMAFKDLTMNLAHFGPLVVMVLASYFHYGDMDIWKGFGVLMLAGNLGHVIQEICTSLMELAQGNGVTGQLKKIMAEPLEDDGSQRGMILPPARGGRELRLQRVGFGYQENQSVLQINSLRIRRGEMTVIVGPSGSGKSSLLGLLSGLEQPSEGVIFVDGIDRSHLAAGKFREELEFIPQDVEPFDDTIFNNIAATNPNVSQEDVWDAAKKMGLHDEIIRLGGYGVKVGQNGINLSLGQKKRLALARLWVRRIDGSPPSIIIVDEPTASLDAASAQRVLDALEAFRGESTVVATTHDVAVMRAADKVVVLQDGQVAEENLMALEEQKQ